MTVLGQRRREAGGFRPTDAVSVHNGERPLAPEPVIRWHENCDAATRAC